MIKYINVDREVMEVFDKIIKELSRKNIEVTGIARTDGLHTRGIRNQGQKHLYTIEYKKKHKGKDISCGVSLVDILVDMRMNTNLKPTQTEQLKELRVKDIVKCAVKEMNRLIKETEHERHVKSVIERV